MKGVILYVVSGTCSLDPLRFVLTLATHVCLGLGSGVLDVVWSLALRYFGLRFLYVEIWVDVRR